MDAPISSVTHFNLLNNYAQKDFTAVLYFSSLGVGRAGGDSYGAWRHSDAEGPQD